MIKLQFKNYRIEREILQIIILDILSKRETFIKGVTLQGGNALRFCYGGVRFSDDIDFVTDKPRAKEEIAKSSKYIQEQLQRYFNNRIEVTTHTHNERSIMDRITVKIYPENGKKRIKVVIEIANGIHTYEPQLTVASSKHFPNASAFINAESLEEIFADKVVSVGGRRILLTAPFKSRDIWDIFWLYSRGVKVNKQLVEKKIKDYKIKGFVDRFKVRLAKLPVSVDYFQMEMNRFADRDIQNVIQDKNASLSILLQVHSAMEKFINTFLVE